jgi:hypothetical protein
MLLRLPTAAWAERIVSENNIVPARSIRSKLRVLPRANAAAIANGRQSHAILCNLTKVSM